MRSALGCRGSAVASNIAAAAYATWAAMQSPSPAAWRHPDGTFEAGSDYRPDVDGLRALAVLLVVLAHADVAGLAGGFVGVDVFFVLSGFLITGLIVRRQAAGVFRFRDFYIRRATRLLPALFVMMLAVLVVGWGLLIPSDYAQAARSALWAAGLAANLFFADQSGGYFSPDSAALPLLHVWSLSVEEQFYLLWPLVLLGAMRLGSPRWRMGLVATGAALSFAYAQHAFAADPERAYFLLPSRAGEFLVGALPALSMPSRRIVRPGLAVVVAALGLLLVLAAALRFDARSPVPGLGALAPCVGAAMVIAAPRLGANPVTRLLSARPAVFVGRMSYSIYLWHWPLVCYVRLSRIEITPAVQGLVVGASLLLGWFSWRWLERDLRARLQLWDPRAFVVSGVLVVALAGAATLVIAAEGLPHRFPYAMLTQSELMAERARYWAGQTAVNTVLTGPGAGRRLLLVGNSHGYDLAYALRENGYSGRIKLIETTHLCSNFGYTPVRAQDRALCAERWRSVVASPDLRVADAIYLHDHWGRYDPEGLAAAIQELRAASPAPIVVFGPKMTLTDDALMISRAAQGRRLASAQAINGFARGYQQADRTRIDGSAARLGAALATPDVSYVSVLRIQCGADLDCPILSSGGRYLYFDAGHWTLQGARAFGARLRAARPDLWPPKQDG